MASGLMYISQGAIHRGTAVHSTHTQHTTHSTQHTARSAQHTHSTQYTALSIPPAAHHILAQKWRIVCDVWTNGGVRDLQRTTKERYSGGARPSSPSAARPNRRARSHRTPCPSLGCTARKLLARFGPAIMARHRRLPQIVAGDATELV